MSMADFAGKASSVLFCTIWLHFQKMSLKGLMPIEHSVCLGGGVLEAGGQPREGAFQHVLYLDDLDPERDTDSKWNF